MQKSSELLRAVRKYRKAEREVFAQGNKVAKLIADKIKDIIPDLEWDLGLAETIDIYFASASDYPEEEHPDDRFTNLGLIIETAIPELKDRISNDVVLVTPRQKRIIMRRLKRLRDKI